jgi:hypothetical protein
VAPYLKEKRYTFPALPAYSTVISLLDGFTIPQNWLVDPREHGAGSRSGTAVAATRISRKMC